MSPSSVSIKFAFSSIRDLNFETLERNFDSILRLSEISTTEFRVDEKCKKDTVVSFDYDFVTYRQNSGLR